MRYDAAIIGAGAEGLSAAAILGQAGLRVLVVERNTHAGGRAITREFHPGHRASPFADDVAAIPEAIFWQLDPARHGAVFERHSDSFALWPDRQQHLHFDAGDGCAARLAEKARALRSAVVDGVMARAKNGETRTRFVPHRREPAAAWATASLADAVRPFDSRSDALAHLVAHALDGRAVDPCLPGSALHLLAVGASGGRLAGGLARLTEALSAAAGAVGTTFSFGLEASDIHRRDGRVVGLSLADGSQIEARSVISTLDIKRTFLTFFAWNTLPKAAARQVSAFRMAGGQARVLFALARPPVLKVDGTGPLHIAPDLATASAAFQSWRAGVIADRLPVTLNVVSARDPGLAPEKGATVTATLGAVPYRLFDGGWTHEKRELLKRRALDAAEQVSPGFTDRVVGADVVTPADIEDVLGTTDGDLAGGEISGDQFFAAPWEHPALPRTPIEGLYLAGSHLAAGAFATCAAGAAAAEALLADDRHGRLK